MGKFRVASSVKLFWSAIFVLCALGAILLQLVGQVPQPTPERSAAKAPVVTPHPPPPVPHRLAASVPASNPAMLASSKSNATWMVPHPGPHGELPMHYYAAPAVQSDASPRIAIMVGGIGEVETASLEAVRKLPAAVSLALTPYGAHLDAISEAARKAGHEMLMGLPMQTDREPNVTEGDKALQAGAPEDANQKQLDWTLSRAQGYAGVTDEVGMAVEETFLSHETSRNWLGNNLRQDGLFLVVTSPGASLPPHTQGRIADLIIDPGADEAQITAALNRLGTIAIANGSALGVLAAPAPESIATLAKWCKDLKSEGISLVPVSSLAAANPTPAP